MLSLQHLQRLEAWSDAYLGNLAPGYSALQDVMQALLTLIEEFIAMNPQQPTVVPSPAVAPQTAPAQAGAAATLAFQEPASREEAYRQLLVIAGYLAPPTPPAPCPFPSRGGGGGAKNPSTR